MPANTNKMTAKSMAIGLGEALAVAGVLTTDAVLGPMFTTVSEVLFSFTPAVLLVSRLAVVPGCTPLPFAAAPEVPLDCCGLDVVDCVPVPDLAVN